ncbi:tetratricopeptide repeat protein [Reichenbachiella sp. MALMAid0571]|uniref:tetratricopeptide repeat protein n=1 Tax=Reichenbachiella sp. MALMAid0571 TaxID=3143939 RepID=UPI0032DF194B
MSASLETTKQGGEKAIFSWASSYNKIEQRLMMYSKYFAVLSGIIIIFFTGTATLSAQSVSKEQSSYVKAKEFYDKGLYSASRLAFDKHIATYSSGATLPDASYYRAVSAVRISQKDGEALIQSYVETYPNDSHASSAYIELAEYYYDQKSYKKAISFFEQSSDQRSFQNDRISFKIGHAYFVENEYDKAIEVLSSIKYDEALKSDAAYFIGYIYKENKDNEKALEFLENGFASNEYGAESLKLYAVLLYEKGEYKEVNSVIDREAAGTNDPILLKLLGDSNYELNNYRLASLNYKEYLKHNRKADAASYFKIGWCYYKMDDAEDAIDNLKKAALAKDTLGAYASYYLGVLYTKDKNLVFASPAFKNASQYQIEIQEEALYAHGKTEFDLTNYQTTITVFTDYRTKFPSGSHSGEVNEMLTQSYLNNKDYQAAISYIESLNYLSPKIKKAYQRITYLKGTEFFNKKEFASAISLFKKSLQHPIDIELSREANFWTGESYSFEKKYQNAVPFYQQSVQQGSDLAKYSLAYAYYNQKQYDRAATSFQSFIMSYTPEVNKRYLTDALIRAGDCFYVSKDYDRAITYYQKSEQEGAKDLSYIHYQSGVVYRYKGDDNKAIQSFEKLIQQYPDSDKADDALFQIAQITYEAGDYSSAINKYQNYIRKYPESNYIPYCLLNQAVSYNNLKNYKGATENYKMMLERFSRHETANSALLGLQGLAGMGEFDDFSTYLDKYKQANPDSDALENIEFETAKSMYYNLQYDESIRSFEKFLNAYPSSTLATDANYFIADANYRKSDFEKSLSGFYAIADNPDYSKYTKVVYRIASLEFDKKNYKESMKYFHKLKKYSNSSKETVNALNGLMENHFLLNQYDSASFYGQDLIDNHRISNEIESSATLHIGKSQYNLGKLDEAFDWLLLLVNSAPDERSAEAKYYVSRIFYDKKEYAQSLKSLFELTENYKAYDLWVGKAFLLMTDNYLATDELFQAEATLNSLIENSPVESIKKQAQDKLKEIESAKKKELITTKDTVEVKEKDQN